MKTTIPEMINRIWGLHADVVVISKSRTNTHIVFQNNVTLSIGWGKMHYCSHDGSNVEIAIWNSNDIEYMFDDGNVIAEYVPVASLEAWASQIAAGQLTFR